jgi:hypothetical protein
MSKREEYRKDITVPWACALRKAIRIRICIKPYMQVQGEEAVVTLERPLRLCVRRVVGVQPQLPHLPAYVSIRQHTSAYVLEGLCASASGVCRRGAAQVHHLPYIACNTNML